MLCVIIKCMMFDLVWLLMRQQRWVAKVKKPARLHVLGNWLVKRPADFLISSSSHGMNGVGLELYATDCDFPILVMNYDI